MNRIGFSLLALMFLQWAVSLTVYYITAISGGAHIGFYGVSTAWVSKIVFQIKAAAAKSALATPFALLFATLIGNIVPFVICERAAGVDTRRIFSLPKVSLGMTAVYGVVALGASLFASSVVSIISSLLNMGGLKLTSPSVNIPWGSRVGTVIMILAVVVAAPLTEEFICRGVLLNVFRRFGDMFAIVASSLVWALLHGNFVQGLPVFTMGLFFGMLALKADSIIPTVILHSLNNILSLIEAAAVARNTVLFKLGVSAVNLTVMAAAIVLLSVFYKSFGCERQDGNARGFAAFFSCAPMIIAILICAVTTALSIKPV